MARIFNRAYFPHVLYSTAVLTISTHSLWHRKEWEAQRLHAEARISLLSTLAQRLRNGDHVEPSDIDRMRRLARGTSTTADHDVGLEVSPEEIRWREVLLGKAGNAELAQAYDDREWENCGCSMSLYHQHLAHELYSA